jgi:hypothetical protein
MGAFTDMIAFCTTLLTSVTLRGVALDGGSVAFEDDDPLLPAPPQDRHSKAAHNKTTQSHKRQHFLVSISLI